MTSRNLSKEKRENLIAKIQEQAQKVDDETRAIFNEVINELNKKKYGLVWEEHSEEVEDEMQAKIPVFVEDKKREIKCKDNESYNFILEGDNLHSLKLLEKTHKNKIDVIYIDPPYNTKNKDFIYNDAIIGEEDSFRHSKWISFMDRRLRIAYGLLKENGLFIASIDDHEQANLKLLCDEIFGEANFITNFIWQKKKGGGQAKYVYEGHEYLICYAKNKNSIGKLLVKDDIEVSEKDIIKKDGRVFRINDDVIRSVFGKYEKGTERRCHYEDIKKEKGLEKYTEISKKLESGEYILRPSKTEKNKHYVCKLEDITEGKKKVIYSIVQGIRTEDGNNEIEDLKLDFDNPKPKELIKTFVNLNQNPNSIILDFFAGSGTTGQAVIELNGEDGGHRNFILCTNNENNICEEVTYPRVKTIITGKREDDSDYSEGVLSNLKYYKTNFVNKENNSSVSTALISNVKEMIQLENHCDIDNKTIRLALSEEELDNIFNLDLKVCTKIYIPTNVLLTSKQKESVRKNRIEIINIPDYYFSKELMEVDELWFKD